MATNPFRSPLREPKLTKTERLARERLLLGAVHLREEDILDYEVKSLVPEEWEVLEEDIDVDEKKVRVTLLLDESVAKFYKAMGKGYQARINRILATFAQMRIGQIKEFKKMTLKEFSHVRSLRAWAES